MSRLLQTILVFSLWAMVAFTAVKSTQHSMRNRKHPEPTELGRNEEGRNHQLQRQAWMDHMHRIAPGMSWQAIDQQTRMQRQRHSRSLDTLAGGAFQGFWKETGSLNQAGRVEQAEPDYANNILYAASAGGIVWKGPLAGGNWTPLNDRLKIPDIVKIKKIGSRLVTVSSTNGVVPVHYTDNEGASWQLSTGLSSLASASANYLSRAVVANDAAHTIYLLTREGGGISIYKSVDQATSFSRIKIYPSAHYHTIDYFDLWTAPNGSGAVYLYQNDSVFSISNGLPFTFLGKVNGQTGNVILSGAEISGNTYLYLAAADTSNTTYFYYSSDAGTNWTPSGNIGNVAYGRKSFEASQTTPYKIYIGAVNLSVSNNAGANWNDVNDWSQYYYDPENLLHADIDGIQSLVDPNGNEEVYASTDGGLYRSIDGLTSVKNLSLQTLKVGQYYGTYTSRVNPEVIYAGSQDQGMQISRGYNSGVRSFDQVISGDYGHLVSGDGGASFWSDYPGFVIYYPDALNSNDYLTWDFIGTGNLWLAPVVADPADPASAYFMGGSSTSGSHLFHLTANGGQINYTELPYDFGGGSNYPLSAFAISPIDHRFQYAMNDFGDFFYTSDGGANWTKNPNFNGPGAHYFYGSTIVPSAKTLGLVYIGGSGYTNSAAYMTTDHGQHFTPINNGLPSTLIYEMAINTDENQLYAATEVGPYVYIAAANQWYDLSGPTVPDQTYWTVDFIPQLNIARFGTYGRGIWDLVVCDSNSNKPLPHFAYTASANGANYTFTNQTPGVFDYHWDFGNGTTSTDKNPPNVRYSANGNYHVTLIATNGCTTDTFGLDIHVVRTGVDEVEDVTIQLFPNPTSGKFLVQTNGAHLQGITVYDLTGKPVSSITGIDVASYAMDLSGNAKGIYLVALETKGQPRKVVKVVLE